MESIINKIFSPDYRFSRERVIEEGLLLPQFNIDGISSENEFIPIYAPKVNLGVYGGKVVHYSIPYSYTAGVLHKSYPNFYKVLNGETMPSHFKTKSMESRLTGIKGIVFKELENKNVKILFMVAVKTEYMKQMVQEEEVLDMSKFAIFISNEFYTHSEYKSMHSKFQRDIIKPLLEQGVELIITNNIEDRCFKNGVTKPKFKSVTAMKEYLASFNQAV
jgi:hypothetical protein